MSRPFQKCTLLSHPAAEVNGLTRAMCHYVLLDSESSVTFSLAWSSTQHRVLEIGRPHVHVTPRTMLNDPFVYENTTYDHEWVYKHDKEVSQNPVGAMENGT